MIKKISFIILMSLMLIIAGCSTTPENNSSNEVENEKSNQQEVENDVQRNENNQRDETQEQIQTALTELSGTGSYNKPGGSIDLEVTIEVDDNNIIQNVEVKAEDADKTSQNYIDKYNQGIKEELIGVSLEQAESPEKINGSSLTSIGFNEALEVIKSQ